MRITCPSTGLFLFLLASGVGCGGGDAGVDGGGPADMTTTGGGQPDIAGPNAQRGELLVNQGGTSSTIRARFVTATGCNRAPVGPCTLLTCPGGNHDTGASAGVLTVTGKNIPANTTLEPTMAGDYPDWVRPVGLFLAGDVITVGAAGGTLPAFSKTATAPAAITVTAPACDGKSCGSFDPTRDLTVSWSGGSDGVEVIFAVSQLSGATSYLSCRFRAADKQGTVPANALSLLPRSDGLNALARLGVASVASTRFTEGSLDTELLLEHLATEGDYTNP